MSGIPLCLYALQWGERRGVPVANPTGEHGCAFMRIAAQKHLELHTRTCAAGYANPRLADLREGHPCAAAVLSMRTP